MKHLKIKHFHIYFLIFIVSTFSLIINQDLVGASEAPMQKENVHNHSSFGDGQVGMSGDYHVEFTARNNGEYRIYITDFMREPVEISKATGVLIINPDSADPEELSLSPDETAQKFLIARGKPRQTDESIYGSVRVELPQADDIFIEFIETISS